MTTTTKIVRGDAKEKLYDIIRAIEVGMFTSVRPDGSLHTRPMITRFDEPGGDLWFFTLEGAPKAREVDRDRQVSVAYADPKEQLYASVSGLAELMQDHALKERLWAPTLITWFPKGPDDSDLALLRVKIRTGEYWDAPSKTMVEIIAAVQAGLDNPPPVDTGDHAKVKMR